MRAKITKKHPKGFGFVFITTGENKWQRAFFHKSSLVGLNFDQEVLLGLEVNVERLIEGHDKEGNPGLVADQIHSAKQ
jgi:hypothetical protein